MAKPYKPHRPRENYFQKNKKKLGENFMFKKSPKEFENDAINIFRDIARGNILFSQDKDLDYFDLNNHYQFIYSIYNKAYTEYNLHRLNYDGTLALINIGNKDPDIIRVNEFNKIKMETYYIISMGLYNYINSYDIRYLQMLPENLKSHRYNI